jgi:dedicator of cytokinesis protein 3
MSTNTTETRKKEFKEKAIAKIEEGRRHLGLDMIVRTASGEQATEKNTPLIQLYNMHKDYNKDMTIASIITPHEKMNASHVVEKTYHLLLDLKIFMCSVGEQTEIYVSIYNKQTEKFITEEFLVVLTGQGMPYDVSRIGKLKSLFIVSFYQLKSQTLIGSSTYI